MSSSLSSLIDNLYEGLHNYKCRNYKSFLDCIQTKDDQIIFKCIEYSKNQQEHFNKDSIKRFENTY